MKRKKLLLAALGAFSIFTLAACSNNQDIVSMKGGKITVEDFFNQIKTQDSTKQQLSTMIIYKVATDNFGDKVDKKEVDKEYNDMKEQYGDQFDSLMKQQGLTEDSLKDQIKQRLAYQAMLESKVKITDKDLKEAWKTFHPEVTASVIMASSKEDADKLLEQAKAPDADFTKLAKENPAQGEEKGEMKFNSGAATLPQEVKDAAFKLKDGEVSDLVTVSQSNGYSNQEVFYIVKMIKNKDKGSDMDKYKKELETVIKDEKMSDQEFQRKVLSDELNAADIKINDNDLKDILAGYIIKDDTKSSDKKDDKKTDKTSSSDKTDASTKEETKTSDSK